jgi:hypothetical protein
MDAVLSTEMSVDFYRNTRRCFAKMYISQKYLWEPQIQHSLFVTLISSKKYLYLINVKKLRNKKLRTSEY